MTINNGGFVIEASQYGDVLVLSNATYQQGIPQKDTCGQSIVFGIHQIYNPQELTSEESFQNKR